MKVLLSALAFCVATGTARADTSGGDTAPSVLVQTVPARTGSLPDIVQAYGAAALATDQVRTVSLQQEGLIGRVHVTAGEAVHRGDVLLEWLRSPAATQAWEQARTALTLAQQSRAHVMLLLDRHLATRDQLDQADKSVADAAATVDALRRDGADLPRRAVTAPFDATVLTVPVSEGDRIAAGMPLATLGQAGGVVVSVGVDPAAALKLKPGETAQVTPLASGGSRAATLLRVDSVIDPRSRLVTADLALQGDNPILAGTDCRAEITTGTLNGWLVPHDAVLQDDSGEFLFQANGNKAVRVPVSVLGGHGDTDIVSGALTAARPVVTVGAAQLADGTVLRPTGTP